VAGNDGPTPYRLPHAGQGRAIEDTRELAGGVFHDVAAATRPALGGSSGRWLAAGERVRLGRVSLAGVRRDTGDGITGHHTGD
jgi:hypothetical protein